MSLAENRQLKVDARTQSAQQHPEQWLISAPHDSFVPRAFYVTRGRLTVILLAVLLTLGLVRYAAGLLWNDLVFVAASGSVALLGMLVMLQLGPRPTAAPADATPAPVEETA